MNVLDKLRIEIDNIDKNIIELINKRQSLADKIVKAKGNSFPFDPERENNLMKKIMRYGLNSNLTERLWRQIIASNLARQKQLTIGIFDKNKYILAAFEVYFGPYFQKIFYSEKEELFKNLNLGEIDIGFIEENEYIIANKLDKITNVANFPLEGYFYKKKFSILINKRD